MDGIEKLASLEWNKTPFIGPEGCYIDGYRAGFLAARKRAVERITLLLYSGANTSKGDEAGLLMARSALERLGADEEA